MRTTLVLILLAVAPAAWAQSVHPEGKLVDVLGAKIWVEREGPETGIPILLIPGGGGGSHDYYHPHLRRLARNHHVITYDGFGRGKSQRAAKPSEYSFARDVAEVEALRAALGLERMHVLGHSYGAFVAQAYAVEHPERVASLIIANGMIRGADWQRANELYNVNLAATFPDLWAKVVALRAAGAREDDPRLQGAYFDRFAEQFALFFFYDPARAASIVFDETTFNLEEYLAICGRDCDFKLGPTMARLDFRRTLARLPMPILVMSSRADGIVRPMFAEEFRRWVPRAKIITFEKSGHLPFVEETARFVEELEAFVGAR